MLNNQDNMDVKITQTTNLREREPPKTTFKKSQPRKAAKEKFSRKKPLKSKSKSKRVKTEKSMNKPQKTSKHFKHENLKLKRISILKIDILKEIRNQLHVNVGTVEK